MSKKKIDPDEVLRVRWNSLIKEIADETGSIEADLLSLRISKGETVGSSSTLRELSSLKTKAYLLHLRILGLRSAIKLLDF